MFQPGQHENDWQLISIIDYAKATREWIEKLPGAPPSAMAIGTLIKSFEAVSDAYYEAVSEQVRRSQTSEKQSFHLHTAIEKLADEWMRLAPLVQAAAVSTDPSLDILARVIDGASQNLKLDLKKQIAVVPHFGRHFNLVRFHYAPNVAVIGVPVFNLETPWEWSVIWHELASLLITQETVQKMVTEFLESEPSIWKEWETKYLPKAGEGEKVSEQAPNHEVSAAEAVAEIGVPEIDRKGWLKEFVEDACSILALGPTAYRSLTAVFKQRYTDLAARTDARHPVPELRLEVAYRLLTQMAGENSRAKTDVSSIKQDYGQAETDTGAAQVADWIWKNQANLVKAAFNWNGEARSKLSPLAKSAHEIVIEARTKLKQPDEGKRIWSDAQSQLVKTELPVAGTPKVGSASLAQVESQAGAYINEIIKKKNLEELQKLIFSETDYLSVSPMYHNHGGNPLGTSAYISVSVSGWEHGYSHPARTFSVYGHRH